MVMRVFLITLGCQQFLIQYADACGHATWVLVCKEILLITRSVYITLLTSVYIWLPSCSTISSSATIPSLMLFYQAGQRFGNTTFGWILPPPSRPIHSFGRLFLNKGITTWVLIPLPLPSESHSHSWYFPSVPWLDHCCPTWKPAAANKCS